jgi:protein phosphatase
MIGGDAIQRVRARVKARLWPARFATESVARTDVGCKRTHNEDSILDAADVGLVCVADGMGGAAGGELASQCIVEVVGHCCDEARGLATRVDVPSARSAICEANRQIHQMACDGDAKGMGSTVVVLLTGRADGQAHVLHVGDSRAYHFRNREFKQLTTDHTVAQAAGLGDGDVPSIIEGKLTRAVGLAPTVGVEVTPVQMQDGDLFVLCSDGLNRHVTDDEMREWLITKRDVPLAETAEAWIDLAKERGGKDNISIILAQVREDPATARFAALRTACFGLAMLVLVAGIVLGGFQVRARAIRAQRQTVLHSLGELSGAFPTEAAAAILAGAGEIPKATQGVFLNRQGIERLRQLEEEVAAMSGWRQRVARATLSQVEIALLRGQAAEIKERLDRNRWDALLPLVDCPLDPEVFPAEVRDSVPELNSVARFSRSVTDLDPWFVQLDRVVEYGRLTALPQIAQKYARLVEGIAPDCALTKLAAMDFAGLDAKQAATYLTQNWPFGDTRPDLLARVTELSPAPDR